MNYLADEWRSNLVLIGGPDANTVTAEVFDRISRRAVYAFPGWRNHLIHIENLDTGQQFVPRGNQSGELVDDYGLIVRVRNPFVSRDGQTEIVVLAGCWGFGTAATAEVLRTEQLLAHPLVAGRSEFEAVIHAQVAAGALRSTELVEVRQLRDPDVS